MTAHRMRYRAIFIFVVLAVATATASDEYPIRSFTDANGKRTGYAGVGVRRQDIASTLAAGCVSNRQSVDRAEVSEDRFVQDAQLFR